MPPQHVEIAETIAALKRALRREKEAPSDQPIYSATNRGNKLKVGADHVHAGALPYSQGRIGYREKVEHAGYTRYILERNPKRFNEYGDELEDSESDAEADADAEEENPYSGIRLEELLCPLKHPSELATHPTLSIPFLDTALSDMVATTEAKLRQERANLWRAKYLNRQCIGDESWMPCENVESIEDWDMFEPKPLASTNSNRKKRKRVADPDPVVNGVEEQDHAITTDGSTIVEMADAEQTSEAIKGNRVQKLKTNGNTRQTRKAKGGEDNLTQVAAEDVEMKYDEQPHTNGVHSGEKSSDETTADIAKGVDPSDTKEQKEGPSTDITDENTEDAPDEQLVNEDSLPPPTRRITRALAAEHHTSNAPTPPLSPTSSISSISSSMLQVDNLFLLPPALSQGQRIPRILSQFGLPIEEILETRRLLTMYIQKQEESVRGYEAVLAKLIKAKRMREHLWEWCKAEGHVGECSDGEDWIDAEAWGVTPGELKKGKDEEEVEGVEEVGRKGKRRRNRE